MLNKRFKRRIICLVFLLIFWEAFSQIINKPILFPSLINVLNVMLKQLESKVFYESILTTSYRVFIAIFISTILALFLGVISALNQKVDDYLSLIIDIIKTIPNASYIMMALVYLGGEKSITIITFLVLFPSIFANIYLGIKSFPESLQNVLKVFPAPFKSTLLKVYFPQIYPYLISSLKVSFGMGYKIAVMAEILGAIKIGIGKELSIAKAYVEMDQIIAWTIWIILLSLLMEKLFDLINIKEPEKHPHLH